MSVNPATLEAEKQIVEAGHTLGALNRHAHYFIAVNAPNEDMLSLETTHLRYEQGRGVVKTDEATCSLCEEWGLNDGKWHEVPVDRKEGASAPD